jgi:hypothetical protein
VIIAFSTHFTPARREAQKLAGGGGTGILAPPVIGEFVKDADKRWRYIRIASVATALVSEGLYTNRFRRKRDACREREHERR